LSVTLRPATMISWPVAAATVVVVAALAASSAIGTLAVAGCIVLALLGPAQTLQALAISTLINFANPGLIHLSPNVGAIERFVLIAATLRILPMLRVADARLLWPLWLLSIVAALTSAAVSPAFAISLMKVITFALMATTVVIAAGRLTADRLRRLQTWFTTVGFTIIALSALTLTRPELGVGLNGGLQGLLNQPQALGIFIAPFAAWSLAAVLFMRRQSGWLEAATAIGCMILIFLTRARTGASAILLALSVVLIARLLSQRALYHAKLGRSMLIVLIAVIAGIGLTFTTGKFSSYVRDFAFKGTETQNRDLGDAFYASRGGGVLQQWQNFRSSPLVGHGFGVYPDGVFPSGVVEFHGIPISAPIEKGFLPTAILEECGVLGGALLLLLIGWFARDVWRSSDLRWRAMFVAALGVNLGECVFLAPGGIGMIFWLLVALALQVHRIDPSAQPARRRSVQTSAVASKLPSAAASTAPA
jgi:O-antigen ligase